MASLGMFFNFLWAMALVVGLAYLAARILKKIGFGRTSPSHYLQQIDYLPLGPKRGVAIMQIVDRTVCLGVTDTAITVLMELDPEAVKTQAATSPPVSAPEIRLSQFAEELWRHLRKDGGQST